MKISSKVFYRLGSENVMQYSLQNDHHMTLNFLTFGARVQQVRLPNRDQFDPNLSIGSSLSRTTQKIRAISVL